MTSVSVHGPTPLDLICNATPTLVGQVRLLLDYRLADWGLMAPRYAEVRSNLHLIATELVTNAVEETPEREVHIRCHPDFNDRVIHFAVWDSSDRKPEAKMPELSLATLDLHPERYDRNGGWGLPLVAALSESCGIEPTKGGKWVWASIKVGGKA